MGTYHICLVEDEDNLAHILKAYMEQEGWHVDSYTNGEDAIEHLHDPCHLWVLDIMLPGIDGYDVLKKIKSASQTPVIFISARDEDLDRVIGLELGSDDYIAKPFLPRELVIRVKKLLQRVYESNHALIVTLASYRIEPQYRRVIDDETNEEVDLTTKELDFVLLLADYVNETLSRESILHHVWGEDYVGSDRAVDDLVRRVRKKMPNLSIETVYGYGYRVASS